MRQEIGEQKICQESYIVISRQTNIPFLSGKAIGGVFEPDLAYMLHGLPGLRVPQFISCQQLLGTNPYGRSV
jgi:hypothetical protein